MKQVNAFETSDGELFVTQELAEHHEFWLQNKDQVESFLDSDMNPYSNIAQRSMIKSSLINWEKWKKQNAIK